LWLVDLNSTNGTFIDNKPIPPNRRIALQPDQVFIIGQYTFRAVIPRQQITDRTMVIPGAPRLKMYDLVALRETEFPFMKGVTYLDNAAAAPAPQRTLAEISRVMDELIGTTKWHAESYPLDSYNAFLSCVAAFLSAASPQEIVFVEGPSVGLNLIAQSLDAKPGDKIIFCDLEHPANVYPWMSLQRDGVVIKQVPSINGGLTLEAVQETVDERTILVAASAIQYFSGHRTDLTAIGRYCRERNILFAVDAIQAVGHMPINVKAMYIDVLVSGGHKSIMAIPTAGFMYVRQEVCERLKPRLIGAGSTVDWTDHLKYDPSLAPDARRFLLGTPNYVGMAGVIKSISLIDELTRAAIDRHTAGLAARALEMARLRGYELTTVSGEHGPIATFKSKLSRKRTEAYLKVIEAESGITIGKLPDRQGWPHLRLSFHCYNTEDELLTAFEALDKMQ
jgi:selenocysteine lyase/cysteine desulfurase